MARASSLALTLFLAVLLPAHLVTSPPAAAAEAATSSNVRAITYPTGEQVTAIVGAGGQPVAVVQSRDGQEVLWLRQGSSWAAYGADDPETPLHGFEGSLSFDGEGRLVIERGGETLTRQPDGTTSVRYSIDGVPFERKEDTRGRIVEVGPVGKPKTTIDYDAEGHVLRFTPGGEQKAIIEYDENRKPHRRPDGGKPVVPPEGSVRVTPRGIEMISPEVTLDRSDPKSMGIRNPESQVLMPSPVDWLNSLGPNGPMVMEQILESKFRIVVGVDRERGTFRYLQENGREKVFSGKELLRYGNRHLWPQFFIPSTAVQGPMMDFQARLPSHTAKELAFAAKRDAEHLGQERTGFIRNVEVSGDDTTVNFDANELRTFPPDNAVLNRDGRRFQWTDTRKESVQRIETYSFARGTIETDVVRAPPGAIPLLRERFEAEKSIGLIPPDTTFGGYVELVRKRARARYEGLRDALDAMSVARGASGEPEKMVEALRKRKKGDVAFILRNLDALRPDSIFVSTEKELATRIRVHELDIRAEITKRLRLIDTGDFAALEALEDRSIDLGTYHEQMTAYKDFGAIAPLNVPPDDPNYPAVLRGVLRPVNGLITAFNYEDDLLAPVTAAGVVALTIAAPEVMIPVLTAVGGVQVGIEVKTGISELRKADDELAKARASGDQAAIQRATAARNLAIEKLSGAATDAALIIAPIAVPKILARVKAGSITKQEAIAQLRAGLGAQGESVAAIEFRLESMRRRISQMGEGKARQIAETIYRSQLEMTEALAKLEGGGAWGSSKYVGRRTTKTIGGKKVEVLDWDTSVLPGKPGAVPPGATSDLNALVDIARSAGAEAWTHGTIKWPGPPVYKVELGKNYSFWEHAYVGEALALDDGARFTFVVSAKKGETTAQALERLVRENPRAKFLLEKFPDRFVEPDLVHPGAMKVAKSTDATDAIAQAFARDPKGATVRLTKFFQTELSEATRTNLAKLLDQTLGANDQPTLVIANRASHSGEVVIPKKLADAIDDYGRSVLAGNPDPALLDPQKLKGDIFKLNSQLRDMSPAELSDLIAQAHRRGMRPVVIGDPIAPEVVLPEGLSREAVDLTAVWQKIPLGDELVPAQLALFQALRERGAIGVVGKNSGLLHPNALSGLPVVQVNQGSLKEPRFAKFEGEVPGFFHITTEPQYSRGFFDYGRKEVIDVPGFTTDPARGTKPWTTWSLDLLEDYAKTRGGLRSPTVPGGRALPPLVVPHDDPSKGPTLPDPCDTPPAPPR